MVASSLKVYATLVALLCASQGVAAQTSVIYQTTVSCPPVIDYYPGGPRTEANACNGLVTLTTGTKTVVNAPATGSAHATAAAIGTASAPAAKSHSMLTFSGAAAPTNAPLPVAAAAAVGLAGVIAAVL